MLNRRFLRVKIFQALYSFFQDDKGQALLAKKNLINSLEKTYELYLFNLTFLQELKDFAENEIEIQNRKYFPVESILKPLKAIVNNQVVQLYCKNLHFTDKTKYVRGRWENSSDLLRKLFAELRTTDLFKEYGESETHSFSEDKGFVLNLFEMLIADSELYNSYLEEIFVNWEDDQVLVITTLQKTINGLKPESNHLLASMHKEEEEDLKFLKELFDLTIQHNKELTDIISEKTQNWDEDRIAVVDKLLMKMALCEVLYFPYIPVKVSINEYLELAKLYSTPNSHGFINGVLDRAQIDLRKNDQIKKLGRGLVE